jgi:uncharacterized protein YndB with AHSA1/START domain
MTIDHIATSTITISAPAGDVWPALVTPELISEYMFGATVTSDFTVGSRIVYAGEFEGRHYEDHGTILTLQPGELLRTTHFSPLSGKQDIPENYHTLTWSLLEDDGETVVTLDQDNNPTEDAAKHSQSNWDQVLQGLKRVVESRL